MNRATPSTTERRARPRGPGSSVLHSISTAQACAYDEAEQLLDSAPGHLTPGEQVRDLVLFALAAAVCALLITLVGPGA